MYLMKRLPIEMISLAFLAGLGGMVNAESPPAAKGHDAFIEGLRQVKDKGGKSASNPRTLSPVVSRFKGWFIDITEKDKSCKLNGLDAVEGISLASESRDTSSWQFVETDKGYLVRAAGGKYKGWIVARDDSAKTRPEGPNLTVTPALRLASSPTDNCHWKLILTKQGLVLEALSGKYKGWFWDFGGNDPSHKESGRDVAINVLLAERVVAGSYFAVKAAD